MAFSFVNTPELDDPLMGFRFGVFFLGSIGLSHPLDFRFQEVSGLDIKLELKRIDAKGQGDISFRLPEKKVFSNLVLKRGMPSHSSLRTEIQSDLLNTKSVARDVLVSILDENALPLNSWLFKRAYPVQWSLSSLNANTNQVIIETMELSFDTFQPFSI